MLQNGLQFHFCTVSHRHPIKLAQSKLLSMRCVWRKGGVSIMEIYSKKIEELENRSISYLYNSKTLCEFKITEITYKKIFSKYYKNFFFIK